MTKTKKKKRKESKKKKDHLKYLRGALLKRRFYCKVTSEQCLSEHFNKPTLPWVFWHPLGKKSLSVESNDFGFFNCPKDPDDAIKTHALPIEKFRNEIINMPRRYVDCCAAAENTLSVIWAALSLSQAENCIKNLNSHSSSSHSFSRSYCKIGQAKFGYFPTHEK